VYRYDLREAMRTAEGASVNGRKIIGLLTSGTYSTYSVEIWTGVEHGARMRGYDLITYRGSEVISDKNTGRILPNAAYDAIDLDLIDGFVAVSSSIANLVSPETYREFCSRFKSRPIVSIGPGPEFARRCLVDNSSGLYELVRHLIKVHGCSAFAFMAGPERSEEAKVRYEAFRRALSDNDVAFDEALLRHGDFRVGLSKDMMKDILKDRPKIDALVAANDDMAISCVEALSDAGYRVPEDVKVIGFDDAPKALTADPPLSTVRQPLYSQAFRAVNVLIDAIEGKPAAMEEYIETLPVIRRSCGCGAGSSSAGAAMSGFKKEYSFGFADREAIVGDVKARLRHFLDPSRASAVESLVTAFNAGLGGDADGYASALDGILAGIRDLNEIDIWKDAFTAIEKRFLSMLSEDRHPAYKRLLEARERRINEQVMRVQSQKYAASTIENSNLRDTLQGLGYSFRIEDIGVFMANTFKTRLGIKSGLIFLFDEGSASTGRIIAGFDEAGKWEAGTLGAGIASAKLISEGIRDRGGKSFFVCPINFNGKDIGLTVLQTGSVAPFIYESVAAQLSSSVWGSFLLKESEEAAARNKALNERIESLVKPMIESVKRVTDISIERLKTIALLNAQSAESSAKMAQTSDTIRGISDRFSKMLEIITIFEDISNTVNLVSINASIEASHAGQYGAGFKVIAKEIKKLSESTRQNAEVISLTLKAVVEEVKTSIGASEESAASFRAQEASMNEILDSMRAISEHMRELDEGSNAILALMGGK